MTSNSRRLARIRNVLFGASALVSVSAGSAYATPDIQPVPEIIIAAPGTPTTARDPVNITGVGQMIVDELNGFIGLCTGTLINPRTVIFAAHCVNDRAATAYGSNNGGQPIGFGFSNSNNTAGASAFGGWLNGIAGGPKYQTTTGRWMYNVNQVVYNPRSLEPNAASFLYADIALATLEQAAGDVPTWKMLFTQLAQPTITAGGTAYHVVLDGYGVNGTGVTGSTGGIDYRRRLAANTLGALASLDDFENFLFGPGSNVNPQNVYWIDFDDPARGTPAASVYDFNAWRDNAVANEGITGSGDSGGPLILDTQFSSQVVMAVLSGGYTRFFTGQPANGYGTAAFYQPLYLYWDWIAANNHYHYVSAVAGNANWTDPTHWVTNLDPSYTIIQGGVLVNAVPSTLGGQDVITTGKFGQACFESGGVSDCFDMQTGVETIVAKPIGTDGDGTPVNDKAVVGSGALGNDMAVIDGGELASATGASNDSALISAEGLIDKVEDASPSAPGGPLPAATLANGLAGATNFVPNNAAPTPATNAFYYDVTLSATGTTTLNTTVVIDRFTMANTAGLDIAAAGSLTSNLGVSVGGTATVNVNGTLRTNDATFSGGRLTGIGTIVLGGGGTVFPTATSLLTLGNGSSMSGATVGTVGTLTVTGNMLFASGAMLVNDISGAGSDKLVVSGVLGANGQFVTVPAAGFTPTMATTAIVAQATTITGAFTAVDSITGVLYPVLTKVTNGAVQQEVLTIQAASFLTQLTNATADQLAIAGALDAQRAAHYNDLLPLYSAIDLLSGDALANALENLAPDAQRTLTSVAGATTEGFADMLQQHLADAGNSSGDTETAFHVNGSGVNVALADQAATPGAASLLAFGQSAANSAPASVIPAESMGMPAGTSGFIDGGVLSGSLRIGGGGGRATIRGFQVGIGGDTKALAEGLTVGFAVGYAESTTRLVTFPAMVQMGSLEGGLFARYDFGDQWNVQAFGGVAGHAVQTRRQVTVGGTVFNLEGHTSGTSPTFGALLGKTFQIGGLDVMPQAGFQYVQTSLDAYTETGGAPAMTFGAFDEDSFLARVGFVARTDVDLGKIAFRPVARAFFVSELSGSDGLVTAAFAGAPGTLMAFPTSSKTENWGEFGIGAEFDISAWLDQSSTITFRYDATAGRNNVSYGTWTGNLTVRW